MEGFREPDQIHTSKSRLNYRGFCLKKCENRDVECGNCFKFRGIETKFKPKKVQDEGRKAT